MDRPQVSKDTFAKLPTDNKLDVLFDFVNCVHEKAERIEAKLDRKKKWDLTMSGFTGLVGGILAVLGKNLLGIGR